MIPRSFLGRLITIPLLMFGLLLIALPSFVLGREFSDVWESMGGSKVCIVILNPETYNTYISLVDASNEYP